MEDPEITCSVSCTSPTSPLVSGGTGTSGTCTVSGGSDPTLSYSIGATANHSGSGCSASFTTTGSGSANYTFGCMSNATNATTCGWNVVGQAGHVGSTTRGGGVPGPVTVCASTSISIACDSCGNGTLESGETCDGTAGSCPVGDVCLDDCTCGPGPSVNITGSSPCSGVEAGENCGFTINLGVS